MNTKIQWYDPVLKEKAIKLAKRFLHKSASLLADCNQDDNISSRFAQPSPDTIIKSAEQFDKEDPDTWSVRDIAERLNGKSKEEFDNYFDVMKEGFILESNKLTSEYREEYQGIQSLELIIQESKDLTKRLESLKVNREEVGVLTKHLENDGHTPYPSSDEFETGSDLEDELQPESKSKPDVKDSNVQSDQKMHSDNQDDDNNHSDHQDDKKNQNDENDHSYDESIDQHPNKRARVGNKSEGSLLDDYADPLLEQPSYMDFDD